MSSLECVGKPSEVSHKQVTFEVTSAAIAKPCCEDVLKEKQQFHGRPRRSLHAVSPLVEDSGPIRVKPLFTGEPTPENTTSRSLGEAVEYTAVALQDLTMREPVQAPESNSVKTGATRFVPPAGDPPPPRDPVQEDTDHTEEEEDEGHRAPLELMAEFLGSVMKKDFQLANKLCQMSGCIDFVFRRVIQPIKFIDKQLSNACLSVVISVLIYEPEHKEAQQFLPLIQEKLLTAQAEEERDDDDDESDSTEEDDSESTESDEETAQSSGSTSSSTLSFSSSSDEEENKQEMRHKPRPPSHHAT